MAKKSRTTEPLSPLIRSGHARLTIIAGECPAGLTFALSGASHTVGRSAGDITLNEDHTVSSEHATFTYRGDTLEVTDSDSLNGVYVRITAPRQLANGDWFRVGGQFFRFDLLSQETEFPTVDGTLVFTSPRREGAFRVLQILEGGRPGLSSMSSSDDLTIGGEGSSVTFTVDPYLSTRHARIYRNTTGGFSIEDLGSTNGTYVRIRGKETLSHGDLVYIGNELIRVDLT